MFDVVRALKKAKAKEERVLKFANYIETRVRKTK